MSANIDLKEQTWAGVNKMSVPLEGGGRQVFSLGGGTPKLQTKTVTYTPTTSQQTDTISPDSGYDGLSLVNVIVNAMQGGADVPTFTLSGVQNGATVTCDKTYAEVRALYDDGLLVALANAPTYNCVYAMSICDEPGASSLRYAVYDANGYPMGDVLITSSAMTYSVPSATQRTMNLPTATKGTVTNHTMTIGVGVTNSRGFYASGVTRGNPIYVSASELVSGSETKTQNGTYDVTSLAEIVIDVPSGIGTLLATKSLGTISTNSTTATDTGQTVSVSGINNYDLLVVETSVNTKTNNRHASTMQCIWLTASSTIGTKSGSTIATATMNDKLSSSGTATSRSSTTKYGIYVYSVSISNGSATLTMYQRYNSTQTGTINGSYTTRVYGVNLYNLIGG